jgi:hypothetical protein
MAVMAHRRRGRVPAVALPPRTALSALKGGRPDGTVNLDAGWLVGAGRGRVTGPDDNACPAHLRWLPLSGRDHRLCRRALLSLSAQPGARRRDPGGPWHRGQPRDIRQWGRSSARRSPTRSAVGCRVEIVAADLTTNDVDDASQVGSLLGQVAGPVASFTGDGAYDQDGVYRAVADHQPEAAIIVPPRATAVPSATAASEPTQRDRHLQGIAEKGRIGWQKMSGYNKRSRVEAAIGRYKQVIGDGRPSTRGRVRSRKDQRRTTEVGVSVHVLNRMLELGRPDSVRVG